MKLMDHCGLKRPLGQLCATTGRFYILLLVKHYISITAKQLPFIVTNFNLSSGTCSRYFNRKCWYNLGIWTHAVPSLFTLTHKSWNSRWMNMMISYHKQEKLGPFYKYKWADVGIKSNLPAMGISHSFLRSSLSLREMYWDWLSGEMPLRPGCCLLRSSRSVPDDDFEPLRPPQSPSSG